MDRSPSGTRGILGTSSIHWLNYTFQSEKPGTRPGLFDEAAGYRHRIAPCCADARVLMGDTEKPNLPLGDQARIADDLYEMDKALWEVLRPMLMPTVSFNEMLRLASPRPPKLASKFYFILCNYSSEAFESEVNWYPRYPPDPSFSKWLMNLAKRIEDHAIEVVRDIEHSDSSNKNFAYHGVTEKEMREAIRIRLREHLERFHQFKSSLPATLPSSYNYPRPPLPPGVQAQLGAGQIEEEEQGNFAPKTKGTIHAPRAVERLNAYLEKTQISLTEFATRAGTTDKTLRNFRKTGRVRRYIFEGIAKAMKLSRDDLLND